MVSKGQFMGLHWNRITRLHSQVMTGTRELDHGGSWVQIPSGARIFSEFSKHLICHSFLVSD